MTYGQQFRDMAGSYAQCECSGFDRLLGVGSFDGQAYVRSFYGAAVYESMAKREREQAAMERIRRVIINRCDLVDDVAGQLKTTC